MLGEREKQEREEESFPALPSNEDVNFGRVFAYLMPSAYLLVQGALFGLFLRRGKGTAQAP